MWATNATLNSKSREILFGPAVAHAITMVLNNLKHWALSFRWEQFLLVSYLCIIFGKNYVEFERTKVSLENR